MQTVQVPALRAFEYHDQSYEAGDPVTVSSAEALALSRRGLVSLDRMARPIQPAKRLETVTITKTESPADVSPPVAPAKPKRTRTRKKTKTT